MIKMEIKIWYDEMCDLLSKRMLYRAFVSLKSMLGKANLSSLQERCNELQLEYGYMLQYAVQGVNDPERTRVYRSLLNDLYNLVEAAQEELMLQKVNRFPYTLRLKYKSKAINLSTYSQSLEKQYALFELSGKKGIKHGVDMQNYRFLQKELFEYFLSKSVFADIEKQFFSFLFANKTAAQEDICLLVSATTLNLLTCYDKTKLHFLLSCVGDDVQDVEIRQRALVGLVLTLYWHGDRIILDEGVHKHLLALMEIGSFQDEFEQVILLLIASRETARITQKLRDEIIPEVMKIRPKFREKLDMDSWMKGGEQEDVNPDWEDLFKDNPRLSDKIMEMNNLQLEGSDVFMATFANLKHFPFFNDIQNWFLPFDSSSEHVDTLNEEGLNKVLDSVSETTFMCNSDKYSFCFSLQQTPAVQREMMKQSLESQLEQAGEINRDARLTQKGNRSKEVAKQYVQDLYRFFKLYPQAREMNPIFDSNFDFYKRFDLVGFLSPEGIKDIASLYFRKEYYSDAKEVYTYLLERQEPSAELLQRIGFCFQQESNFQEALTYYLRADIIQADDYWNIRKIASCYRSLHRTQKALKYFKQADILRPGKINNKLPIGHCLIELKQYDEALSLFFEVDYLDDSNPKVWHSLAWCSFVLGKFEQAEKYSDKTLDGGYGYKHDYINRGHLEWCKGNGETAMGYYLLALEKKLVTPEELQILMEEDKNHLLKFGIATEDFQLMLDKVFFEFAGK